MHANMTSKPGKGSRKPSLLIFLPDQQRADTIACYGSRSVHSPNLDKLASESMVFRRAYVTQPVCTPSRSSLMTGTWPHVNGCHRNSVPLPPKFPVLPQLVTDDDYRTGYMGKWHLGDENQAQRGFREWISTEGVSDYSQFLIEHGLIPEKADGSFSELTVSELPWHLSKPRFLARHAIRFIEKHRHESFLLVVAFAEPHSPYNGPFNNEHLPHEIELDPTAVASEDSELPLRYRLMREWQQAEAALDRKRRSNLFFFGITPDEYRSLKRRYLGLVTLVDESIGSILESLEQAGRGEDTIVLHTSDHGDMMGSHHLFAKEVMFEQAVRVPYLIRLPNERRGRMIEQPVSHIDFIPTLLDLLGQPLTVQLAGKSRVPLLRGEAMPAESIFIEWAPNRTKIKKGTKLAPRRLIRRAVEESTRTVISPDGWKLNLRDKDLNELYNLNSDPFETRNLYYAGQYTEIISRQTDEIRRWQSSVGDTLKL
jgi:arylsulfatase A-like enzyme